MYTDPDTEVGVGVEVGSGGIRNQRASRDRLPLATASMAAGHALPLGAAAASSTLPLVSTCGLRPSSSHPAISVAQAAAVMLRLLPLMASQWALRSRA